MKKALVLGIILVIFLGCSNRKSQDDSIGEQLSEVVIETFNEQNIDEEIEINFPEQINDEIIAVLEIEDEYHQLDTYAEKLQYFGTVFNTFTNTENVSIYAFPSLEADIVYVLEKHSKIFITGVSAQMDEIDGHMGHWLKIIIENIWGNEGWVFSSYVIDGTIKASELRIIDFPPREERRVQSLIAAYDIDGTEHIITLYPYKLENQDFYTFSFDWSMNSFHYSNIPGSYAWYPETNELVHVTYIGTDMESAWSIFTDDFRYVLQDFGTSPGPRGLGVWRISDGESIFSGMYYDSLNMRDNTINIVYTYSDWNISRGRLDEEVLAFGENFRENHPPSDEEVNYSRRTGLGLELIIICDFNLDTGIRTILTGQYIYTQ